MTSTEGAQLIVRLLSDVATARSEAHAYRLLAVLAIHRLHDQHRELERLRDAHARLVAEYRAVLTAEAA